MSLDHPVLVVTARWKLSRNGESGELFEMTMRNLLRKGIASTPGRSRLRVLAFVQHQKQIDRLK
jgi:hypothetical protein